MRRRSITVKYLLKNRFDLSFTIEKRKSKPRSNIGVTGRPPKEK